MGNNGNQANPRQAERSPPEYVPATVPHASPVRHSWLVLLPVLFLAGGAAALSVDCPLARWCLHCHWPAWAMELLQFGECFGNGLGAALVILATLQLAPDRRSALLRVVAITLGAGVAADVLKLLVVRVRPHHFDFAGTVWQSFGDWLAIGSGGSSYRSFPSGHTAVAVGLAIALVWLYPRGFWVFLSLAVLAAGQRLASGAHYLSDVLFGATAASMVAVACLSRGPLPAWFDRWESWRKPQASRGGQ